MTTSTDTDAPTPLVPGAREPAVRRVKRQAWRMLLPILLLLAAAGAGWQMQQLTERSRDFDSVVARLHLDAERLTRMAHAAATGDDEALAELRTPLSRIATVRGALLKHHRAINEAWRALGAARDEVLQAETRGAALEQQITRFESIATGILVASDELVDALVAADESAAQVRIASRQLLLIQRISANVRRVREGGPVALGAADRFGRDMVIFGDVNTALLNGNRKLGITATEDPDARHALEGLGHDFREAAGLVERILDGAGTLARRDQALRDIEVARGALVAALGQLRKTHSTAIAEQPDWRLLAGSALALALIGMLGAALRIGSDGHALGRRLVRGRTAEDLLRRELGEHDTGLLRLGEAVQRLADGAEVDLLPRAQGPDAALTRAVRDLVGRLRAHSTDLQSFIVAQAETLAAAADKARNLDEEIDHQSQRIQLAHQRSGELLAGADELSEALAAGRADTVEAARGVQRAIDVCGAAATGLRLLDDALGEVESHGAQLATGQQALTEVAELGAELAEQARILWINASLRASVDSAAAPALARLAEDAERVLDAARDTANRATAGRDAITGGEQGLRAAAKRCRWSGDSVREALARAVAALGKLEPVLATFEERTRGIAGRHESEQRLVAKSGRELTAIGEGLRQTRGRTRQLLAALERLCAIIEAKQAEAVQTRTPEPEVVSFPTPEASIEEPSKPIFALDRRGD